MLQITRKQLDFLERLLVQYTKIGFGSTHDQFFTVGDTVTNNSKPLPVMLRASDNGAAISETGNALDINIKTHGVTLQVDTLHTSRRTSC